MKTVSMVVFDMAGTTVFDDDAVGRCIREALAGEGISATVAETNAVMGITKPEAIRRLIARDPAADASPERIARVHRDFVTRMKRFYAEDPSVRETPGTVQTFARLRQAGIKVVLNTAFSRDITDVILHRLGWFDGDTIDASMCGEEVAQGRPHADMIQAFMARFGIVDAETVVKVGDTPADIGEGRSAGCGLVVAVTEGSHSAAELAPLQPDALIGRPENLPELLQSRWGISLPA